MLFDSTQVFGWCKLTLLEQGFDHVWSIASMYSGIQILQSKFQTDALRHLIKGCV